MAHLKGNIVKLSSNNISISIPKSALGLLQNLNRMAKKRALGKSRSEIILDAVRMIVGSGDLEDIENRIFERYKQGRLQGPNIYDCFANILEWGLREYSVVTLMRLWNLNASEMARLLYKYVIELER